MPLQLATAILTVFFASVILLNSRSFVESRSSNLKPALVSHSMH